MICLIISFIVLICLSATCACPNVVQCLICSFSKSYRTLFDATHLHYHYKLVQVHPFDPNIIWWVKHAYVDATVWSAKQNRSISYSSRGAIAVKLVIPRMLVFLQNLRMRQFVDIIIWNAFILFFSVSWCYWCWNKTAWIISYCFNLFMLSSILYSTVTICFIYSLQILWLSYCTLQCNAFRKSWL